MALIDTRVPQAVSQKALDLHRSHGLNDVHFGTGFWALFKKEVMRFWRVGLQTVFAPMLTSVLYLLVFSHALSGRVIHEGIPFVAFLIPGLMMMSMQQNSFANVSSSFVQSKMTGNLIFIQLPPLTPYNIYGAYVLGGVVRGLLVGLCLWLASLLFYVLIPAHFIWMLLFALLACGIMAALGLIAGLWSEKFDHLAVFQNFIIMPATFLSGVFFSIKSIPPLWEHISYINPVFYMIDGFRYGFLGVSDVSPWQSLVVIALCFVIVSAIALRLLVTGYKIKN